MNRKRTRHRGCGAPGGGADCRTCAMARQAAWQGGSTAVLDAISQAKRSRPWPRKTELFAQGAPNDGFYCVVSGVVVMSVMDARGDSVTVEVASAGDTFGFRSFLADEPHAASAVVYAPGVICHVDGRSARAIVDAHPELERLFLQRLARQARRSNEAYLRAQTMSVRERLIHFLLSTGRKFSTPEGEGGLHLRLPIRQTDVAAVIGTVPETLSRTVRRMRDEQAILVERGRVTIPDPAALEAEIADWMPVAEG